MLNGLIYVSYQNNAAADGTPAGAASTIVAFNLAGGVAATYSVTGRGDGIAADPLHNRLLVSVNEDLNSSLYVITPGASTPLSHYNYSPSPAETGTDGTNGGTDSISVSPGGTIYVAHSNPDLSLPGPNNTAAAYTMTLGASATATLTPLFGVNDTATVINPDGGPTSTALGLTDPDSNTFFPDNGGTLVQDAQADSKLVLASRLSSGTPSLAQLNLTNAVTPTGGAATPQLDDVQRVTGKGTLYAVDQASGTIYAINTASVAPGTVFVSQPKPSAGDQPNDPALGVVDLSTGVVTHVDSTLGSPKGLLFVPTAVQRYWEAATDGGIFNFGLAGFFGSMGGMHLNKPVVGIAAAPDGKGYWEAATDGGIFNFGSAGFFGSMGAKPLNQPVVGIAPAPDGKGYWEVAADGGIFNFGSAGFFGSMGGMHLNKPIVGIAAAPDGKGYWEVASDGGIFNFGSAGFLGSMGAKPLNKPVVGIAAAPDGQGYWEAATDGGIFNFGSSTFQGSMGGTPLNQPVVGITAASDGMGYWEVASDGGIFNFGSSTFQGSMGGVHLNQPVVGIAS